MLLFLPHCVFDKVWNMGSLNLRLHSVCIPCSGANDRDVRRKEKTQKIKTRFCLVTLLELCSASRGRQTQTWGSQQQEGFLCCHPSRNTAVGSFPSFKKNSKKTHRDSVQRGPAVTEDETSLTTTQSGPWSFMCGSESSINSQPQ